MNVAEALDAAWKLVVIVAALAGVLWAIVAQRRQRVTGEPTPEERRVIVEAQKERSAIDAAVEASDKSRPTATDDELERRVNR